jgi:hypothetical protein
MAINTIQHFKSAERTTNIFLALTTSEADIFAADAVYLRDLTKLICINENASSRDLTIYEKDGTNDKIIAVITIPGNAGQSLSNPAIKLISDAQIPGVTMDAFGNYLFRCPPNVILRAKASAASSLFLIGRLESFQL